MQILPANHMCPISHPETLEQTPGGGSMIPVIDAGPVSVHFGALLQTANILNGSCHSRTNDTSRVDRSTAYDSSCELVVLAADLPRWNADSCPLRTALRRSV